MRRTCGIRQRWQVTASRIKIARAKVSISCFIPVENAFDYVRYSVLGRCRQAAATRTGYTTRICFSKINVALAPTSEIPNVGRWMMRNTMRTSSTGTFFVCFEVWVYDKLLLSKHLHLSIAFWLLQPSLFVSLKCKINPSHKRNFQTRITNAHFVFHAVFNKSSQVFSR